MDTSVLERKVKQLDSAVSEARMVAQGSEKLASRLVDDVLG